MTYKAFLSYSHAGDARLAAAIQSALHRFARPWHKVHALKIFRDKTSLSANPALWKSIAQALSESEYLLLLASPPAAGSEWVRREVEWFLQNRSPEKILILVTAGEIVWDSPRRDFDWEKTTALPDCLRRGFAEQPFHVDFTWARNEEQLSLRHSRFRDAVMDLAAPLHGKRKDELHSEDIRQHRRNRRLVWSAGVLLSMLTVLLGFMAFYARRQQSEAERQRREAEHQRDEAERQKQVAEEQRQGAERQRQIAEQRRREADEQRRLAEEQQQLALSRQLAAQARSNLQDHLQLSLLQSVEACRVRPTREARDALLATLLYSAHLRRFVPRPPETLTAAAWSPDGSLLASVGADGRTVMLSVIGASRTRPWLLPGGADEIKRVAFSPDGKLLAAGTTTAVLVWDVKSRRLAASLTAGLSGKSYSPVEVLAFSPDGNQLAGFESESGVLLWDMASRQLCAPPLRPKRWETALTFGRDGKVLASGSRDGSILLWDAASGKPFGDPLKGHERQIFSLAFSPDGKILASGSEDRTILLWDCVARRPLGPGLIGHEPWQLGHEKWGLSLAFSPDGRLLASGGKDKNILLWDVASRESLGPALRGHREPVMSVAFGADGESVLSVGQDNAVLQWQTNPLSLPARPLDGHGEGVLDVAFSPDGKTLAAACVDRSMRLWDIGKHQLLAEERTLHEEAILKLFFSREGALFSASSDRVAAWQRSKGARSVRRLSGRSEKVVHAAFTADGRWIASSDGTSLDLWRDDAPEPVRLPIANASGSHQVFGLAFSPDGKRLASGGFDGTLALWDVASRQLCWPAVLAHRDAVRVLAFSPDGRTLATAAVGTASFDESVRLWSTETGKPLLPPLSGQRGPIRALAFSPDGATLACADYADIVLWDLESRQRVGPPLRGHTQAISSLAFSPDGRRLASGAHEDRLILWDVSLESWLSRACSLANRSLSEVEWRRLVGNSPYRATCP